MLSGRSILWYLRLLVAATVVPLVGVVAYGYYVELHVEADEAKTVVRGLADLAAAGAEQFVAQERRYLEVLVRGPLRGPPEPAACRQSALDDFQALHPELASLMLLDAAGRVVCTTAAAGESSSDLSMAEASWFRRIREGEAFAIGGPVVSTISGHWIAVLAHAVRDERGALLGVAALATDLARYAPIPPGVELPPGTTVTLLTPDGAVLARSAANEVWLGKNVRLTEMARHALSGNTAAEIYTDIDGVRRLCGFKSVAGVGWAAVAGIPLDVAFKEVKARALGEGLVLLLVTAAATGLALAIARIVATPVRRFADAARALADGKLDTRLTPAGPRELVEVAEQFNRMLDVRAQTERALGDSQKRLQALFDQMRDGILLVDGNAAHVDANPALCKLLGYSRAEMLGMALWDDVPPSLQPELGEMWKRFLALGWLEGEFICQRKDGSTVDVEYLAVAHFMPDLHLCSVRAITERRLAEAKQKSYAEHLKLLSRRLVEVQEDERRHLAAELHDRTGQNLTAINLHLSMIREQLPPDASAVHARVDDAMGLVASTLEAVRDVMADLRPPVLEDYGLFAAIRWYGDIFARRAGLPVATSGSEPSPRLQRAAEVALFRVAQEALTNVAKHAKATRIEVALEHGPEFARLTIADDGIGFDLCGERQAGSGWGIISMEERVEAVGGSLQVLTLPGQGTRVVVEVPIAG